VSGLATLLEGRFGSLAVASLIVIAGAAWFGYVHWHRGAPVETTSSTGATDGKATPAATAAEGSGTTTDLMTRAEPKTYNETHRSIVEYVSAPGLWASRGRRRIDLDESPPVFWFFVVPLIAATLAAGLFALYSEAIVNTVRGVAIGAAVLAVAVLLVGWKDSHVPVLWWAAMAAVAVVAIVWSCALLTGGAYGHDVTLLRERADGRSLSDAVRIMLHRFAFGGWLGLVSKALGVAVMAAVGCYATFRLFGVLAAVESVRRTDPGSWHRDTVEKVYPRGGPRNAVVLVLLVSLLGLGLSSGEPARWIYDQLHDNGGSATLQVGPRLHTVTGTNGKDVLTLTARPDRVFALGGNDRVIVPPDGVKDIVNCGAGHDEVVLVGRRESGDRFISCEQFSRR
jgi:hypothetical protein